MNSYNGKSSLSWALIALLAASGVCALWGQGTSYLTGFVVDPTQAAIADASVVIRNPSTGVRYDLKTTDTGVYRSPALPPRRP